MLKKFFAVTVRGSLYEVTDEKDENDWPRVMRLIPDRPEFHLRNGSSVGIGHLGICLFSPTPKYGNSFEAMNISYWGGCTSGLVALFLERSQAETCLASGDRTPLSEQFANETRSVLEAIGDSHPFFVIGHSMWHLSHARA